MSVPDCTCISSFIASHSPCKGSHDSSIVTHESRDLKQPGSHDPTILLQPITLGDHYTIEFKVHKDGPAVLRVVEGVCNVNGVRCDPNVSKRTVGNGEHM